MIVAVILIVIGLAIVAYGISVGWRYSWGWATLLIAIGLSLVLGPRSIWVFLTPSHADIEEPSP